MFKTQVEGFTAKFYDVILRTIRVRPKITAVDLLNTQGGFSFDFCESVYEILKCDQDISKQLDFSTPVPQLPKVQASVCNEEPLRATKIN